VRGLLLWMASNKWLRHHIPRLGFARRAVLRFMPGEDAESALRAATDFKKDGIAVVLTRLGENVTQTAEADEVANEYLGLLERIAAEGLDGEISVKLTQLGFDLDEERTLAHTKRLAERAGASGKTVWVDMEGSPYTARTLAFYERLKTLCPNTGLCVQAYLHRTAADLERLLPLSPSIRLVKGAYAEPPAIAYQTRHDVDANFAALAIRMLDAKRSDRSLRIALATHDLRLIDQVAEHARAASFGKEAFEVQMLYGIRVDQQRRLARESYVVRDLISFGSAWYPWYLRRLAERPANVVFALRQILP
jgi:proline dehydrogenase